MSYRTADERTNSTGAELSRLLVGLMPNDDHELIPDMSRLDQVRKERTAAADAYFRANAAAWNQIRSFYVEEPAVESRLLHIAAEIIRHHVDLDTGTGRHELLAAARANPDDRSVEIQGNVDFAHFEFPAIDHGICVDLLEVEVDAI